MAKKKQQVNSDEQGNDEQASTMQESANVGRFWRGRYYVHGHGMVEGVVNQKDLDAFTLHLPEGRYLEEFISDRDVMAEWIKSHTVDAPQS